MRIGGCRHNSWLGAYQAIPEEHLATMVYLLSAIESGAPFMVASPDAIGENIETDDVSAVTDSMDCRVVPTSRRWVRDAAP